MTAGRVTVSFWIFESNIALEYRLGILPCNIALKEKNDGKGTS